MKKKANKSPTGKPQINLPKGTLSRINLGQSFAEYDRILTKPGVFVETPAIKAALESSRSKCFFVGRRGTGKTAITYYIREKYQTTAVQVLPQIFAQLGRYFKASDLRDTKQMHFKSLVNCFKRALEDEVLKEWHRNGLLSFKRAPTTITRERNFIEDLDFDFRLVTFVEEIFNTLDSSNNKEWLKLINKAKYIGNEMDEMRAGGPWDFTLLIDRIDESWDGSDEAVVLLMALMHACVEITATVDCVRPLLFLRENIFERVRSTDTEFSRLETFVVSMDWSKELLLELVERRLNLPLTAKLPLRGQTWDVFFEPWENDSSRNFVFNYCQDRPRDVLTYCSFAIESAQANRHERVTIEDLQAARRRFSDSRLKDLGDEYAENYPQIQLVLGRFYGLGSEFTVPGITAFIQKLLIDEEIKNHCSAWIYSYTQPDRFIQLLYDIGFVGIKKEDISQFRSLGPQSSTPPPITTATSVIVHPSYADALNLQNIVIGSLDQTVPFQKDGLVIDLPGAINLTEYHERLTQLRDNLKSTPPGDESASKFEDIVGDIIRLCFFRSLTNVEPKVRSNDGRVIRDWIAANHASTGFWEMIRHRYQATQIIWECKNYSDLDADAFHQAAYYMTKEIGKFIVLVFRGELKKHHYEHIKRVAGEKEGGIILLLTEKDLDVFLRQAIRGKAREEHIQEIYDRTVREIS